MEYDVELLPVNKAILSPTGILKPLCDDCVRGDCTNPIREQTMSVFGKSIKMRLWVVNNVYRMVVACPNGYIGAKDVEMGDDSSDD